MKNICEKCDLFITHAQQAYGTQKQVAVCEKNTVSHECWVEPP